MIKTIKVTDVFGPVQSFQGVEAYRQLESNEVLDEISRVHPELSPLECMQVFRAMREQRVILCRQWCTGIDVWTINPSYEEEKSLSDFSRFIHGPSTVRK